MSIIRYKLVNTNNGSEIKVDCVEDNLVLAERNLIEAAVKFGLNYDDAKKLAKQESVWVVPGNAKRSYTRTLYASPLIVYVRRV